MDDIEKVQLGKSLDFLRTLWAMEHWLKATSKQMATSLGVTGPQRLVIRLVGKFPSISPGTIAELLHIHPSTLTGVLTRLEAAGLILRQIDKQDRRKQHFTLTKKGSQINATNAGTVEAAIRRAMSHFTEAQLEQTQEVVAMITKELQK